MQAQEAAGGHTIEKHVGQTDMRMKERIEKEGKPVFSISDNLDFAEKAINDALSDKDVQNQINNMIKNNGY